MRKLSAIRDTVRQLLNDEFASGSAQDFKDDELNMHIGQCLAEISEKRPYEVKETLTTTASSKELDISDIEDLLKVEKAEYPVDSEPPEYRNVSVFGNTLRFEYDSSPAADQDIYLYCWKLHQLTEETSTLNPQLERVLIDGTVAYAALAWINNVRAHVKEAIARIADINEAVDNMTGRIEQAVEDLEDGRDEIPKVGVAPQAERFAEYALREISAGNAYQGQSQGYLRELSSRLSISNLINSYQVWANNKLALYKTDLKGITKQRVSQLYSTS